MARSALALLTDPVLHRQVAAAAHEKVRTKFCEEKIVPLYEAYYEEVLARRAGRAEGRDRREASKIARMKRYFFLAAAFLAAFAIVPQAQMRVVPVDEEQGHVALGLALRHLANAGIYMMATAHPDDENNGLLVMLNRGQGYRTTLATATRGNGGQNEIGPELFEPLGVLRTEELAALHRFDGAEQYFTRAVDFGYTIDINETLEQWGRDEIIGDYVRLIRTIRPDVISAMSPTALGPGQHAHHALSAILSHEAYKLAGDPTKYPEQIKDGLRPWQPKKFYFTVGGPGGGNPPAARARAGSTWRSTIRCSARRFRRSAPKRAACTSARARRSCSRCPGRRRRRSSSRNRRFPARWTRTSGRCSTASTRASPASRSSPAPARRRIWSTG